MACEITANVVLWVVSILLFHSNGILSYCLIAWTLGLRHALDADHLCAIDLSLRRLIALHPQHLPVTVGFFFSLGHSTVVIVATMCVIISAAVADHLDAIEAIGGDIGVCVSASFLLLISVINAVILWQTMKHARAAENSRAGRQDEPPSPVSCMARSAKPLFALINKPWRLYPLGLVFGLGFDTASTVLLLAVSAIAGTKTSRPSDLILLPLLFTAGMTAIDTLDGIMMAWAYAPAQHHKTWKLYTDQPIQSEGAFEKKQFITNRVSLVLTVASILLAFSISVIEFMGLAADKLDGGDKSGLEGRWWRFWLTLNDNSQFIGVFIIGLFLTIIFGWLLYEYVQKQRRKTGGSAREELPDEERQSLEAYSEHLPPEEAREEDANSKLPPYNPAKPPAVGEAGPAGETHDALAA